MIWHEAALMLGERGDEFAVQVAPGRVAMQHHNRFAVALVNKVHFKAVDEVIVRSKWETAAKGLVLDANHMKTPIQYQDVYGRGDPCGRPGFLVPEITSAYTSKTSTPICSRRVTISSSTSMPVMILSTAAREATVVSMTLPNLV